MCKTFLPKLQNVSTVQIQLSQIYSLKYGNSSKYVSQNGNIDIPHLKVEMQNQYIIRFGRKA